MMIAHLTYTGSYIWRKNIYIYARSHANRITSENRMRMKRMEEFSCVKFN